MRAFALAEIANAWAARAEILDDEPDWAGPLFVVPIELDERNISAN